MRDRYDIVCLSPHLDDAVLSCGGMLASEVRRGARILVVTIMAGDAPDGELGPLAMALATASRLKPETAMERRRREDAESCRRMGVDFAHWRFRECVCRPGKKANEWLYPTVADVFGKVDPSDAELTTALVEAMRELPPAARTLAPLGVGGHVDHRVVRDAGERAFGRTVLYYEDFPYAQRFGAVWRTLGNPFAWRPETVVLGEEDLQSKIEAVRAHVSQTAVMFHGDEGMVFMVRRYARRRGGERIWRRRTAGG
jgi:LmbE family N-acetylglucosaminyl deacetylase